MNSKRSLLLPAGPAVLAAVLAAAAFSGCASSKKARRSAAEDSKPAAAAEAAEAAYVPGVDVTEASLRGEDFSQATDLETVHFEYDSASLSEANLAVLKKNASFLKSHSGLEFLVAGHCDARGTIEYNLALGQRRAREVREYYIRLGVPGDRLATLSYGKEQPLCGQATEECWAQNRRAETLARARRGAGAAKAAGGAP